MSQALVMILNWNGFCDTLSCIESISAHPTTDIDYMVFDNGSDNDSYSKICDFFIDSGSDSAVKEAEFLGICISVNVYTYRGSDYYICPYPENLGFAKACNAVGVYASSIYKTIIFLNNDTIITPNTFSNLHAVMGVHDAKIVIPQIRFFDRPDIIWNCGGEVTRFGRTVYHFAGQHYASLKGESILSVGFATGCCVLFDLDYFIKIGGYSEKFFFGEEDVELCMRLRNTDVKIICDLKSVIYHKVGSSLSGSDISPRKAYLHILNRLINMRDYMSLVLWPFWAAAVCLRFYFSPTYKFPRSLISVFKLYVESCVSSGVSKKRFQEILKNGI